LALLTNLIKRFIAPALPKPTQEYDQKYFDNLVNVLRIYFNQLDNLLGQLVNGTGIVPVSMDGTNTDAFGRIRVSQPYTLFDSQNRYASDNQYDTSTASGGSTTYLPNESSVQMSVTSTTNSEVVRQTFRVFPYQPGKGLLMLATFCMNAPTAKLR